MPFPLYLYAACSKAFVAEHKKCLAGAWKEPIATTPQEWLSGRDTGTSSCTIYSVMQNTGMGHYDVPHDPDDFGRCYRLLQLFPEWRKRLPEMLPRFPEWKGMIDRWDELTALYEEELNRTTATRYAPKLYALMQKLRAETAGRTMIPTAPQTPPKLPPYAYNIHGEVLPEKYRFTPEDEGRLDSQDFYSHHDDDDVSLLPYSDEEADRFMAWRWYGQFMVPCNKERIGAMAWRIFREREARRYKRENAELRAELAKYREELGIH